MVGGEFRALEEAGVDRVLRRALHLASPQEPSVAEGDVGLCLPAFSN